MSPEITQRLNRLLTAFDAERLGEGNLAAGANVLAAMACTIANIHRRGACLTGSDGVSFQTGSSLLASGPLTSSLIGERVTAPLAAIQGNVLAHIQEWELGKQAIIEGSPICKPKLDGFRIQADLSAHGFWDEEMRMGVHHHHSLFSSFSNQVKRALCDQPLVFVTGATPGDLHRNLRRSHLGRPLLHGVLRSPSHCADLADCCLPVIDGSMTIEPLSTSIHGHVLLTDPSRLLDEVVGAGGEPARWLLRLPWLVDGNAGPEIASDKDSAATQPRLDRMEQRYEQALRNAMRCRLDHTVKAPVCHDIDLAAFQTQWVGFLVASETACPGISAAARPLLATLVFGLYEMASIMERPEDFLLDPGDVLALAAHLVRRMGNAHAVMTHTGEREQKQRNHLRILDMLSEGPMSARDLGRRFHRMTTNQSRDLLADLKRNGSVAELSGDRWQLAALTSPRETTLILNI